MIYRYTRHRNDRLLYWCEDTIPGIQSRMVDQTEPRTLRLAAIALETVGLVTLRVKRSTGGVVITETLSVASPVKGGA